MIQSITRRDFLKVSGGFTGLFATAGLLANTSELSDLRMVDRRPKWNKETKTICPFDSCNCGQICYTDDKGNLVNIEGDPDNPLNRGAACAKGASLIEVHNGSDFGTINSNRVQKVKYRASGAADWTELSFDDAINKISDKIKATRDAGFTTTDSSGNTVNRCESIACFGGATLFNEECHMISKAMRALGLVFMDSQDRYDSAAADFAVWAALGNYGSSNNWTDIANTNCILVFGASPMESYPACVSYITHATEQCNAALICVDPRFSRTAAKADVYVPMRNGADLVFLGGLIRYILNHIEETPEAFNMEYLINYTNIAALVSSDYKGPDDLDGLFSGYNSITKTYNKSTWSFQTDSSGNILKDTSLQNSDCVFQIMKKHYSRYSVQVVNETTGADPSLINETYALFTATGTSDKSGTIIHSMGATQHTVGAQIIHAFSIIQLLLGNMGMAGGGIHTIRGEGNSQGSSDFGLSVDYLPGYLKTPIATDSNIDTYIARTANVAEAATKKAALISLLKSWFGNKAAANNDFAFNYLPKMDPDKNYTAVNVFEYMAQDNSVQGALVFGQNLAVSSMHQKYVFAGLDKLDWLVVADKWENETASFWKRPGAPYANIKTEVFLIPTAASMEKDGSTTNSARLIQWSYKAVDAPGDAKSEFDIIKALVGQIKSRYSGSANAAAINDLTWNYTNTQAALAEINGTAGTSQLTRPSQLREDGSTACGNYQYIGVYVGSAGLDTFEQDNIGMFPSGYVGNRATRTYTKDVASNGASSSLGLYSYYGYAWPQNQRILNNRASVNLSGRPFNSKKAVISYENDTWVGDKTTTGAPAEESGILPFVNMSDGVAQTYCTNFADGPLPEHYEPWETPLTTNPLSKQLNNPLLFDLKGNKNPKGSFNSYPIVATTCRTTEHSMDGQSTRNMNWLVEMMPEAFVEISKELAASLNVDSGDMVRITSARNSITVRAMVTARLKPMTISGLATKLNIVSLPWHWGFMGKATGGSAASLAPAVADANGYTPEYKAFLVKIEKVV
ncbi:MAG: formate dehydrogenase-N subunit alpha [Chloroflexi bacterium]|nr:formate dehydrogenase-N subunit alpha [Chloroflexota bacterium]